MKPSTSVADTVRLVEITRRNRAVLNKLADELSAYLAQGDNPCLAALEREIIDGQIAFDAEFTRLYPKVAL